MGGDGLDVDWLATAWMTGWAPSCERLGSSSLVAGQVHARCRPPAGWLPVSCKKTPPGFAAAAPVRVGDAVVDV
eukprot:77117-Chlamydomonas_euryale.AAC.1